MQLFLISGLSGSGKSVALNMLEDSGYYCVDNLPADLLDTLPGLENGTAGLDVMKYCTVDGDTLDCRIPLTAVPGLTDKA